VRIELVYSDKGSYLKEGTLIGISIEGTIFYIEGYEPGISLSPEEFTKISEDFKKNLKNLQNLVIQSLVPTPPSPPPKRHFVNESQVNPPLVKDRKRLDP
jgi:hypothetical protein